eukprot:3423651-Pleurochrysis_carterae.AAC.1
MPAPRHLAPTTRTSAVSTSRCVLLLFSGPFSRPDGIASFLTRYGMTADCVDNCPSDGGGDAHNVLVDSVYERLLQRCSDGYDAAVFASPPCSTFSVSRFFSAPDAPDGGPPPVRDRDHVLGLPDIPTQHARELAQANEL